MKDLRRDLNSKRLYFDGGFGTLLQAAGLENEAPELWNSTHAEEVIKAHSAYIEAGSDIITANTFGVNKLKYENYAEIIAKAVLCAKKAVGDREIYIAYDMGPTGKMLKPLGDLPFEKAVDIFASNVREAVKCGVDLILIETMNDSYETKAAVVAAKENSDLPIFVTNAYDRSGKLMTGGSPLAMIAMLEGLGVDAIGMNCSFGPDVMLGIIDEFIENSSLPIVINPNAGLPKVVDGKTVFDVSAEDFSVCMKKLAEKGAGILGGCCGTTPEYIAATVKATADVPFKRAEKKHKTLVSSYAHAVEIGKAPVLIGERINPTGKPLLKEALRFGNKNFILSEGIKQAEKGVHILDVNVGLPGIDEVYTMRSTVEELQAVVDLPLQIDSSDPATIDAAMRIYNGKPLVNSVNGEDGVMESVFPSVKKYGGAVIALTIDGQGIPATAEGRVGIAKKIIEKAAEYGIDKSDIIVDPLCLTVSADSSSAKVTLEAVRLLHAEGINTSLGVSNISFGLPKREKINSAFFTAALNSGLDCAIINPFCESILDAYYAYGALSGIDKSCVDYIAYASASEEEKPAAKAADMTLFYAITKGLKEEAAALAEGLLKAEKPLDIINGHIVPALDAAGKSFEEKKTYLPQLLMTADAATAAFDKIKQHIPKGGVSRGDMILATVKGDIHDIGKNIVRVISESYGFRVFDLGRDVPSEEICECVRKTGCKLVGLSALMTTTVPAMEETIKALHAEFPDVKVIVGGAVLNAEYAEEIKADRYCANAMETVYFAQEFYK